MQIKHKTLKDFQFITSDKKIFTIKSGTILEEYKYKSKNEVIDVDRDIVNQNPEYFQTIDWKVELISQMKISKIPQPALVAKKIIPFIEDMFIIGKREESNKDEDENIKNLEEMYKKKCEEMDEKEKEFNNSLQKQISDSKFWKTKFQENNQENKEVELAEKEKNLEDLMSVYQKKINHIADGVLRFKNDYPDLYEKYKINPEIIMEYIN